VPYCAILLLFLTSLFSLGQSGTEQDAPAQQKQNETKSVPAPVIAQPSTQQQQGQPDGSCKIPPLTDSFWSNWALVLVGIVAAWIALETLGDLKEQTSTAKTSAEAAKKSADAAFLNAQAVINAERAWIIGIPEDETDSVQLFGPSSYVPQCQIGIKNSGRTPGKIVTIALRFEKMTNVVELPPEPYFGIDSIKGLGGQIVVPGDTPLWIFLAIDGGRPLAADERIFVRDKMLHLVCWGEINYEDVLTQQPHMTRFCCFYTHGRAAAKNGFQTAFDAPASYRETT